MFRVFVVYLHPPLLFLLLLVQQLSNGCCFVEPLFPPPTFPRNYVFTFATFQAFQIKTGVTADLVQREEKEEQTSQKKQEDKEVARQLHPGESKSGCVASKSLTVQTILNFLVVNIESRRGSLLEGGLVEFCAGDKGQVGGSGSGFLGVGSCLEHHGSLEECPGFWGKMEKRIFKGLDNEKQFSKSLQ